MRPPRTQLEGLLRGMHVVVVSEHESTRVGLGTVCKRAGAMVRKVSGQAQGTR